MATSQYYVTAGLQPDDNGADDGSSLFYITAGLPPDDTAAPSGAAPTGVFYGPLVGPLGGPI